MEGGTQDLCRLDLVFKAGTKNQSKPLVAAMCNAMLFEGTNKKNGTEIHESIDFYGSYIQLDVNRNVKELDNKIVVIENADPGYDWIFGHKILGLVTKFGGINSHMTIRCSELSIPAVIGCGEQIYTSLLKIYTKYLKFTLIYFISFTIKYISYLHIKLLLIY